MNEHLLRPSPGSRESSDANALPAKKFSLWSHPLRALFFATLMVTVSTSIHTLQYPALLLLFLLPLPTSRLLYRTYIYHTQRAFGSLMVFVIWFFSPTTIVLTGDVEELYRNPLAGPRVVIANHQIYSDWAYLWALAWALRDGRAPGGGAHGSVKIILKEELMKVPVFGWGMRFFEFIFLKRKWADDQHRIREYLNRALDDMRAAKDARRGRSRHDFRTGLWLMLFPEGTVITDETVGISKGFLKRDRPFQELIARVLAQAKGGNSKGLNALRRRHGEPMDTMTADEESEPHSPATYYPPNGNPFADEQQQSKTATTTTATTTAAPGSANEVDRWVEEIHPRHVLLPRTSGLYECIKIILGKITALAETEALNGGGLQESYGTLQPVDNDEGLKLIDVTLGYPGLSVDHHEGYGYDVYPIERVFIGGGLLRKIYMHVHVYSVKPSVPETHEDGTPDPLDTSLTEVDMNGCAVGLANELGGPKVIEFGDKKAFSERLARMYYEKEEMLDRFYTSGELSDSDGNKGGDSVEIAVVPNFEDAFVLTTAVALNVGLAFGAVIACTWMFGH
ncbi:acyltransferase-domain-containing protein [Cladochytrium replicatum]|nr:acyltransferase-domain-containing protein [Cladochytrium replicatum]